MIYTILKDKGGLLLKVFITFSPQQGALSPFVYETQGNSRLLYGPTGFPIIPAINGYAQPGEPFRVVLIVQNHESCIRNADAFRAELDTLCQTRGLVCEEIQELHVPFDNRVTTHIETFQKLIDVIRDGDDIHACITYGSKPAPMAELMALRYARQVKKDTYISCVVYGQVDFRLKEAKIFDETALVHLDDIIRVLAQSGAPNPGQILKNIIDL